MEKVLNLTQHKATPEQLGAGVVDLLEWEQAEVARLLTFDTLPTREELKARANELAEFAREALLVREPLAVQNQMMNEVVDAGLGVNFGYVLIGGAGFFMPFLERALEQNQVGVRHAFSVRESVQETLPNGTVRKINIHRGVAPDRVRHPIPAGAERPSHRRNRQ